MVLACSSFSQKVRKFIFSLPQTGSKTRCSETRMILQSEEIMGRSTCTVQFGICFEHVIYALKSSTTQVVERLIFIMYTYYVHRNIYRVTHTSDIRASISHKLVTVIMQQEYSDDIMHQLII